jgi:hypothetical protein
MTPLVCPHCGVVDIPTISPGSGPHAARANCRACGRFLKWLPRALGEGMTPMGCLNKVLLCGTISKNGVTVKYAQSGTPCASFVLVLSEQG